MARLRSLLISNRRIALTSMTSWLLKCILVYLDSLRHREASTDFDNQQKLKPNDAAILGFGGFGSLWDIE